MTKEEKLLTEFPKYLKAQIPTYRVRDVNIDLAVKHFIKQTKTNDKN